jgi:nitric-oxide synthase
VNTFMHIPTTDKVWNEIEAYQTLIYRELQPDIPYESRLNQIRHEFALQGTYTHTTDELAYGAMVAWRNNARCIGRLHWNTLEVHDYRHLTNSRDMAEALIQHIRYSTNGGRIRPLISVFAPRHPEKAGIRIWNSQLIRYAGYRQANGTIIGDPLNVELTEAAQKLGWRGEGTPFDPLPLILQLPNRDPEWFEIPRDAILEVPLSHPDFPWFARLGLKWHALPAVSNMRLEIGGLNYTAAPFSGWYMVTEVGTRDLGDEGRYNLLPVVAKGMGLDMSSERTLWRDRALVELTAAVMHSFSQAKVTMVDHHTASRQFLRHIEREEAQERITPAKWSWIVPPLSASATPVYFRGYPDVVQKPNFFARKNVF